MTPNDWKDLATTIQAFGVVAAVIIGGIWALFRYRVLNEEARATAELARLRYQLERRATVRLMLETNVLHTAKGCVLRVSVEIENSGTKPEIIDWSKAGVRSALVEEFKDGSPVLAPLRVTKLVTATEIIGTNIDPGEVAAYPFLIPIEQNGTYYVEFYYQRALEVTSDHAQLVRSVIGRPVGVEAGSLHASTFVQVSDTRSLVTA